MGNKFAGIVFIADHETLDKKIDELLKEFLENNNDVKLVFCKTSYSKLWLSDIKPAEEGLS